MAENFMMNKVKAIDYDKLDRIASDIAKRNNKSKSYIKRDMIFNFVKYGIGYTDYLKGDYVNLTKEEKKDFVTTKSFRKLLRYLNNYKYDACMSDKVVFNRIFKDFIKREFIDLRISSLNDFKNFIKDKKYVFAKPLTDFGGHRIRKIEVSSIKNLKELYDELINEKLSLIEEEIVQHKELNKLNPYAVNSFRIVTLVKDGEAHILANALRININDESVVGCQDAYMRLDENGHIISKVVDDLANEYECHPIAKIPFKDVTVPFVKESFELALNAALMVPEVRYVGWDIAITEKGPLIMEGNEYPSYGLVQYYLLDNGHVGHLKQIRDILGSEMENIKL